MGRRRFGQYDGRREEFIGLIAFLVQIGVLEFLGDLEHPHVAAQSQPDRDVGAACPGRGRRRRTSFPARARSAGSSSDFFSTGCRFPLRRSFAGRLLRAVRSCRRPGCRSGSRSRRPPPGRRRTSRCRPGRESASIRGRLAFARCRSGRRRRLWRPARSGARPFAQRVACPRTARTEPIRPFSACRETSAGACLPQDDDRSFRSVASGQKGRKCAQSGENQGEKFSVHSFWG